MKTILFQTVLILGGGAWLAENHKVIAPKDWFGNSNNKHLDTNDIIPERWTKI